MSDKEPQICKICGKEFIPKTKRPAMFCSVECRAERKRQLGREYYQGYLKYKQRKKPPKQEQEDKTLAKVKPIVQMKPMDKMSGEELLHYGQIQSSMNLPIIHRGEGGKVLGKEK